MKKVIIGVALLLSTLCGATVASAKAVTWTLSNIKFSRVGFQSNYLNGTFDYDDATNTFSNVNLLNKGDNVCCWTTLIATSTSTASALNFSFIGKGSALANLDLASPMTDAGGIVALTAGSMSNGDWMLVAGQSISAPITASVPEPASWALMIGGFALTGAALRRRRSATGTVSTTFG